MSTLTDQINQPYVGEYVQLYHLDLNPLGENTHYYFTPSSSSPISFNGKSYVPMPINIKNISNTMNGAPGRVTLSVSGNTTSGTYSRMLIGEIISMKDLVGARLTFTTTFKNFLDGEVDGGQGESFPPMRFIIYSKDNFGPDGISWTLTSEIDRPGVLLPLRQTMKSDVGTGALYSPGMTRLKL